METQSFLTQHQLRRRRVPEFGMSRESDMSQEVINGIYTYNLFGIFLKKQKKAPRRQCIDAGLETKEGKDLHLPFLSLSS